jgi:hypothetical protein
MLVLSKDAKRIVKQAVERLAAEEGVSEAQAAAAIALFCPILL